mgnify:CR=1 FL=1
MKELSGLVPSSVKVNVIGPAEREFLTWIGGSILGSMATFQAMWMSKNEYVENGSALVHRKCFWVILFDIFLWNSTSTNMFY